MSHKPMTSWERRSRRTKRITVWTVIFFVATAGAFLAHYLLKPYETWDLTQFYTLSVSGYDGAGSAEMILDDAALHRAVETLRFDYQEAPLHLHTCTDADFDALENSVRSTIAASDLLHNGDAISISYTCDTSLAKKLKLQVEPRTEFVTVTGLPVVTMLSDEDVFANVKITAAGISPDITVSIANESTIPFLRDMTLQIEEPKDTYANGDVITITAYYNEEEALQEHYALKTPSGSCKMTYEVHVDRAYVEDAAALPAGIVDQAYRAGLGAFTNANEYGVRIFCEAGLVPVYINKQATFEWVEPKFLSAYFKCPRAEYLRDGGNHFNDLDIIYEVTLRQANKVACTCYAVVRFSDLILNEDGTVDFDFSDPKVMSADYKAENVKKTVVHAYESTHTVTKLSQTVTNVSTR